MQSLWSVNELVRGQLVILVISLEPYGALALLCVAKLKFFVVDKHHEYQNMGYIHHNYPSHNIIKKASNKSIFVCSVSLGAGCVCVCVCVRGGGEGCLVPV